MEGDKKVTYYGCNESNLTTVDKIIVLVEEIAVLKSRFDEHDTGNLRTAVGVLENRVQELKDRIHD
jgi:hypothetical protein|tara:strand:+ start:817 stop:1014 length:198 start_codon:yes stop_codon:yes gene_type:complete